MAKEFNKQKNLQTSSVDEDENDMTVTGETIKV